MNFIRTLNYKVYSDSLSKIKIEDGACKVINTISPNSYGIATKDTEFDFALKDSDYLVLDGVYFALSSILLQGKNIKRNQGPDVFHHFISRFQRTRGKVFFLGSTTEVLNKIESRLKIDFPLVEAGTFSPPFKKEFSDEDNELMIDQVNSFKPDILFIGMTCPKQEKWAIKNRDKLNAKIVICIGNVFDWYAGTQKSIHPIWFKLRLGWFIRIFLRPEVFKRNIGNQMIFFKDLLLIKFKIKKI
ncbi:WecB/TagA/CpsF family glycosyltransferase [Lutimonas saemankumensis]|uniref:WecB/TagA/CpsF family glycosyltransferase n=1 Tax=Lutimonas saemankumensis TaxID=483016 RepID=UPI001CD1A52B|nr:WecB/TagA/CpsF family glycosyltransferase [Lutimonas saemankumensis]MCA0932644.1 WecB/TagA/CpsF family glycosyltransferase [Lutimonas saemankumensis]